MAQTVHEPNAAQPSTAELVKTASEQISRLVRDELRLAQAELARKGKHAGVGAGLFGAGGLLALYGVAAVLTAVILLLAYVLPAWLAALIVTAVYGAAAAVLGLRGKTEISEAGPPTPERTVESVKEDVQWAKTHATSSKG
jgi:hypothetical protein